VPAKAERVAQGGIDCCGAGGVGHVVQIALRVGRVQIDGGREQSVLDRQDTYGSLDCARAAEQVTELRFAAADGQAVGVLTEDLLDRLCFGNITDRRACTMRVDVVYIGGGKVGVGEGKLHRSRCAFAALWGLGDVEAVGTQPVAH